MTDNTSAEEQRRDVHMKMLSRSINAKDAGHLTVVLLGFAVDVALEVAKQRELALIERLEKQAGWYSQQFTKEARDSGIEDTLVPLSAIQKEKEKL